MNIFNRCGSDNSSFAEWIAIVMLLAGIGLSDAMAVGWFAGVVSTAEVAAAGLSFALIAYGAIFTAYEMARLDRA